ncbi:MAG: protein kinase [Verrucomicrobia bacterium]|nr:protein kinase [Verrucomicrobiota bacterium]
MRGYTILETLGRGGTGTVYLARQHGSERRVALKMVQSRHLRDEVVLERFRSEVRLVGALSHPHVLPLYEAGVHDGMPFFSMQWAEGGTLAEAIARGPLEPRRAAELLERVARAVHHAHQRGVLHRDLKPANILLGADGKPYVSDFGVARVLTEDGGGLTLTGSVVGTPGYLAPEQAAGGAAALTTAADVFGLGAILFAALTGQAPFVAETPLATLRLASESVAPPLTALRADLPRDLEIICARALAPEVAARYASAGELADELRRWLDGRPILARRVSAFERTWRWATRHPLPASLAAALAFLLAAGVVGIGLANVRLARSRDEARAAERAATARLFEARLEQARAARRAEHREEALTALAQARPLGPADQLRDETIGALALSSFTAAERLGWKVAPPAEVAVSADQQRAAVMQGSEITLRRLTDGEIERRLPALDGLVLFLFPLSPDGRYLAARSTAGTTFVWELASGRELLRLSGPPGSPARNLAFSPDSRRVALGRPDGRVEIFRLPDLAQPEVQFPGAEVTGLAWRPDGQQLAVTDGREWRSNTDGHLAVHRTSDGATVWQTARPRGFANVAWSSAHVVAAATWDGPVLLYEAEDGAPTGTLPCTETIGSLRFSPSGELLVAQSVDDTIEVWDVRAQQLLGSARSRVTSFFPPAEDRLLLHLPDGGLVWHRLRRSAFWRSVAGSAALARPQGLRVSPNGAWIVTAGRPRALLLDLTTLETVDVPVESQARLGADFTRDGTALLVSTREHGLARVPLATPADSSHGRRRLQPGSAEWVLASPGWLLSEVTSDGRALLTAPASGEPRFLLAEPVAGGAQEQWPVPPSPLGGSLSADGRLALTGHWTGGLRIWELPGRTLRRTLPAETPVSGEFSGDGRWVVTREAGQCVVWEIAADWARRISLPAGDKAWGTACTAFSPDSRQLAVAGDEGWIDLYDVPTWRRRARLHSPRPLRNVYLVYARQGRFLIAAGHQRETQIWDLERVQAELAERGLSW